MNPIGCDTKNEMKKCYQHVERKAKKQMQYNMEKGDVRVAEYLRSKFQISVRSYLYT